MMEENVEWFESWFNSPYYHILYKERDDKEAQRFITNLINHLNPSKNSLFLDVACGKGRHSKYINSLEFNVDGFDLSKNSIEQAKKNETCGLRYFVNDIRIPLNENHYDIALNLFTSFGYFEDEFDNQLAINSISKSLKPNGVLVLDFMNCNKVVKNLVKNETKLIGDVQFNIERSVKEGFIVKNINFTHHNQVFKFQEKVKFISLEDFKSFFLGANLKLATIFGDYDLSSFDVNHSDRLILIATKQ